MSERPSVVAKLLRPIVQLRHGESGTALLMFLYSYLAMTSYKLISVVPRRWMIPVTQVGIAGLLLLFWFLFTFVAADWVAVAFYVVSLILSILLISQFWTLANDVYDPRQAKRIFGFIGGGASLGGATGAGLTAFLVQSVGSRTMILMAAAVMGVCMAIE